MDIYSHIINKWARDYIGNTVDETKILMERDFPEHKMHVIQVEEEDPDYSQKFFKPPIKNILQVIEYKGTIVDAKVY
jgi:hypothetical protein